MSSARLQTIIEIFGPRLVSRLRSGVDTSAQSMVAIHRGLGSTLPNWFDGIPVTEPALMVHMLKSVDPTPRHRYTQWLVKTWLAGGYRFEDLDKARETLELWHSNRHRLPIEERDLNRYGKLASVWSAVSRFRGVVSARQEDLQERAAARAESVIVHEGADGFTVAVPLTERAAKWWGRGTRWCTAADKNNAFQGYHLRAPLVVVILPNGENIQMWSPPKEADDGFQMMDASDNELEVDSIRKHWAHLGPLLEWSLRHGTYPDVMPPEYLQALDRDGWPDDIAAHALAATLQSIRHDEDASAWDRVTEDDLVRAIAAGSLTIANIPPRRCSDAICDASLQTRTGGVRMFPDTYWLSLTSEKLLKLLSGRHADQVIENIPRNHPALNLEAYMAAASNLGATILAMPEDIAENREVQLLAASTVGAGFLLDESFPALGQDEELVLAACFGGAITPFDDVFFDAAPDAVLLRMERFLDGRDAALAAGRRFPSTDMAKEKQAAVRAASILRKVQGLPGGDAVLERLVCGFPEMSTLLPAHDGPCMVAAKALVSLDYCERLNALDDVTLDAILARQPRLHRHLSEERYTAARFLRAIQHFPELMPVPSHLETDELRDRALAIIAFDGRSSFDVSDKEILALFDGEMSGEQLWDTAMGLSPSFLPRSRFTPSLINAMLMRHGSLFEVPESLHTPELIALVETGQLWSTDILDGLRSCLSAGARELPPSAATLDGDAADLDTDQRWLTWTGDEEGVADEITVEYGRPF